MGVRKGQWGWLAAFTFRGRKYKKEGFGTRWKAAEWEARKREELRQEIETQTPTTFSGLATRYLDHCRARMQRNTWRQKSFVYRLFIGYAGNLPAQKVTKQMVSDYIAEVQTERGNKAANRDLRDLRALYNWGMKQELVVKNPADGIERFPEEPALRYIPPAEDIDKVLLAAELNEMDLILAVYHTGGRISEVLRITWEDVNFEQGWVRLWTRKRRGGELQEDYLPMGKILREVMERRWRMRNKGTPLVFPEFQARNSTYRMMRRICDRARVRPFGFTAIRHHVASILQDSGKMTIKQIQLFLRHRRQTTTEQYLHVIDRGLTEVSEFLDGRKSECPTEEKSEPISSSS